VKALNADLAWAVGQLDTVRYTTNAGSDWIEPGFPTTGIDANGVAVVNEDTVWVALDYGGIYRSDNGGATWTSQESNQHGHHLLRVSALDADNAWIIGALASSGTDFGVILHTDNGGDNWETQSSPVNASWSDLAVVDGRPPLFLPLIMSYSS